MCSLKQLIFHAGSYLWFLLLFCMSQQLMIIANSLEELTNTVYLASDTVVHGAISDDDSGWKLRLGGLRH